MELQTDTVTLESGLTVSYKFKDTLTTVVAVYSLSCIPLFSNPVDCSPLGSSVHGISQAKKNWSGLPFPSPGDLLHPGFEPESPVLVGGFLTTEVPRKPTLIIQPSNFTAK